jgi:hypothetical protein
MYFDMRTTKNSNQKLGGRPLAALSIGSALLAAVALSGCAAEVGDEEQVGIAASAVVTDVELYTNASYSGTVKHLAPGVYDVGSMGIGNDTLSSIKAPTGWRVFLYQNSGWSGTIKQVPADTGGNYEVANLGTYGFNDQTSSIVVQKMSGADANVIFFKNANYTGTAASITDPWGLPTQGYLMSSTSVDASQLTSIRLPTIPRVRLSTANSLVFLAPGLFDVNCNSPESCRDVTSDEDNLNDVSFDNVTDTVRIDWQ